MIQVALAALSLGLIIIGAKGFTRDGLEFSSTRTLTGTPARVVGVLCILGGIGLIPLALLAIRAAGRR